MDQLSVKLKNGKMHIVDAPIPDLRSRHILVRNIYSVISSGTESGTVGTARKSYLGKARERPRQLKEVTDSLKSRGIEQTYRAVMKKLDAYSPLGYSCAGQVTDVAPEISEFQVGDMVACGGLTASHSEVACVPVNLCVKLSPETDLRQAAYNTMGAIALQGVRQADLRLGECCAIIGLGLLGQLTGILLRAAGVRVVGIDVNEEMVRIADENCADLALRRDFQGIESRINEFADGYGCDAVIITAASDSMDPINFAGAIARKKGTIVVVGAVPTGFDREPHYYRKELSLKMACSYGPGRYDPNYEEKGMDYPVGYVRWTEKRNMQAFQELIVSKKIDIGFLTTHTFKLEDAPTAYDMILNKDEPYLGIVIEYDTTKPITKRRIEIGKAQGARRKAQGISIGFIGAGSYAQSYLLPNIPKSDDILLKGVMTSSSTGSRSVAERFGFEFCTGNAEEILRDSEINTVFIASRHDSHAKYVVDALKEGKNVFVEKPLCLTVEQLDEITALYNSQLAIRNPQPILMVGYNRRFSPLTRMLREKIGSGPKAMSYRVNAGNIPADSWIQDPEIGGGRIIGEVCHFVDYLTHISGSLPITAYAATMRDPENLNDTLTIALKYENGSIGSIQYFANGPKSMAKEYVEIFCHGTTAVLSDFREIRIYGTGKPFTKKLLNQDKGQRNEVRLFIESVRDGSALIPIDELVSTTEVTFRIVESIRTGQVVRV